MIIKCVIAVFCLMAAASTVMSLGDYNKFEISRNISHNLIVGAREYSDRQVYQERITKPSSWWQIITLEKTINIFTGKITQVQALDQKINGNGAYAAILSGGPGSNFVTFSFKSQRSHGIDFNIVIYAK